MAGIREEQLEGLHGGDGRVLTADILRGLGLRARATWTGAAGTTESSFRNTLRPPLSDDARTTGDAELQGGHPSPDDRVRALDHSGPPRSLEVGGLPWLIAAVEAQASSRHSPPPPLQQPTSTARNQRPPWQSIDLVHLARVAAGNADTTPADADADVPLFRRPSDGVPVVIPSPTSESASEEKAATSSRCAGSAGGGGGSGGGVAGGSHHHRDHRRGSRSESQWSSYPGAGPPLSRRRRNARAEGGSRSQDCGPLLLDGGGGASNAMCGGGGTGRGAVHGEVGYRGAPPPPPPSRAGRSADEAPLRQCLSAVPAPTGAKRMRGPAADGDDSVAVVDQMPLAPGRGPPVDAGRGYQHMELFRAATAAAPPPPPSPLSASGRGRYRGTDTPPPSTAAQLYGGGSRRAMLSPLIVERRQFGTDDPLLSHGPRDPRWQSRTAAAEAAVGMTGASPPSARGLGSRGRSGGEAGPDQLGGDLAPPIGLGRSLWQGEGGRGGGAGARAEAEFSRGFCRNDRLLHGSPLLRDQHRPHLSQPPLGLGYQEQDRHPLQRSIPSPAAGTTVAAPRSGHGGGGGDGPDSYNTALRPLLSGLSDSGLAGSARRSGPLPGLAEVAATMGDPQAAAGGGGGRRFNFYELRCADPGRLDGVSSVAGAAAAAAAAAGEGAVDASAGPAAPVEWGNREERRFMLFPTKPTKLSTAKGCIEQGCDRLSYGYEGSKKPTTYCAKHRLVGGKIVPRHATCKDEQCTRQPSFGMEGDQRASYCAEHRKAGMVNVTSRRCQQSGCLRHPNFGFPGDKRASYCKRHLEKGMVDVVSRRCRDPSCARRPLYNMRGLRPVFCSKHKLPGMMDVVSARCQEPGCSRHPSFGYASDNKARRCARHRLENMESVKAHRQQHRRERITATAAAAATTNTMSHPAPSSSTAPLPSP